MVQFDIDSLNIYTSISIVSISFSGRMKFILRWTSLALSPRKGTESTYDVRNSPLFLECCYFKIAFTRCQATVTHIRQKYWIPAIRQCVQVVIRKCVTCRRVVGKAYRVSDPPQLPKIRVEDTPPFTVRGVDFSGALYVKQINWNETKAYICLFTCASTRAVHLEVVTDLTKESFLQAFKRFVNRKSLPKLMISDNATTFVAASNHMKALMESTAVQETLSGMGIEWRFNPQRAPWYGGWWERLVGMTKIALKESTWPLIRHFRVTANHCHSNRGCTQRPSTDVCIWLERHRVNHTIAAVIRAQNNDASTWWHHRRGRENCRSCLSCDIEPYG